MKLSTSHGGVKEEVRGGPAGWFVTFGDLLTLLLSFFVVTISQSARMEFSPPAKVESSQRVESESPQPNPRSLSRSEPGTVIAESDVGSAVPGLQEDRTGRPYAEALVVEADLRGVGLANYPLRDRLTGQGVSVASEYEVVVCGGATRELAWGYAERDAQEIARQLSDAGPQSVVRVSVLGPHCGALERSPYLDVRAHIRMYG